MGFQGFSTEISCLMQLKGATEGNQNSEAADQTAK